MEPESFHPEKEEENDLPIICRFYVNLWGCTKKKRLSCHCIFDEKTKVSFTSVKSVEIIFDENTKLVDFYQIWYYPLW